LYTHRGTWKENFYALTDIKVRSAKPQEKEYTLVDGDGMFLLIHPNGSKYWRFRFRSAVSSLMAFGVYPQTSLLMLVKRRGQSWCCWNRSREHKRALKEEQAKETITFESVAREWHATNKEMVRGTQSTGAEELEDNLFPAIGMRSIDTFSTRDLLVPIKVVEATGRLKWLRVFSSALMRLCVMPQTV
jgi:hypothetical protein